MVRATLPAGLAALSLAVAAVRPRIWPGPIPLWWEITLQLKATGEYRLGGGEFPLQGRYRFTLRWTGCMESDDHDYLLYRLGCELSVWEAEETFTSPTGAKVLTTADFPETPSLDMKYVLRQGNRLNLNFVVRGFSPLQGDTGEALELMFPASAESDPQDSRGAYNEGVILGSNQIWVEESEIYDYPVERTFNWEWKRQRWLLQQQQTVFTLQSHQVEVALVIIPHASSAKTLKTPKRADGIYRKPGGASDG
jgi:hypothetical protein